MLYHEKTCLYGLAGYSLLSRPVIPNARLRSDISAPNYTSVSLT